MHIFIRIPLIAFCLVLFTPLLRGQERPQSAEPIPFAAKAFREMEERSANVLQKIDKHTERYLSKLLHQERKLKAKLFRKDSTLANQLFDGVEEKYQALKQAPKNLSKFSQIYSPRLDSLATALNFLKGGKLESPELASALSQLSSLQDQLNQTEKIRSFLSERRHFLQENLGRLGMLKNLKGFQKQAYYYSQQIKEYRALWEDPSKLEQKLLEILSQTEAYKDFFHKHSQLGSLFSLPGSSTVAAASLAGLQTRASVQQGLQGRFGSGAGVQQILQQNMQGAQGQLSSLKDKLSHYSSGAYGNSSSDIDMLEGFKPNAQKTKTFLHRLEYGANIQSQKARSYFPATSDLGLSLGYKFTDNSSIGIGASYKIGWGRGWDHIRITHEGLGLRSYIDMKLKGSFYLSGGYEQNYRNAFQTVQQLHGLQGWQTSGLLGLSRKYRISKKLKGDIKLLWDFLSYQQVPRTQAVLFRVGYNIK